MNKQVVRFVDTHTEGEPTRVILSGCPSWRSTSARDRLEQMQSEHDDFRHATITEPRGYEAMVGALLLDSALPKCNQGVLFFNNVGYLGMCGHGTIGLAAALAHLGQIEVGEHFLETPVGMVSFRWHGRGKVTVQNVPSFRTQKQVALRLENGRTIHGDVAWGGNWFFLCDDHGLELKRSHTEQLRSFSLSVRQALGQQGVTGADGAFIDHIELMGPSDRQEADSRNFVLCPGGEYDRSPCGTGTSAKVACLHADGKLKPGQPWKQESIVGGMFEATYHIDDSGQCIPSITGSAYVVAQGELVFDADDPFKKGFPR